MVFHTDAGFCRIGCVLGLVLKGAVMQLLEWFLWAHLVTIVVMVEIASTVSFGMLLVWGLWREYLRLFRS